MGEEAPRMMESCCYFGDDSLEDFNMFDKIMPTGTYAASYAAPVKMMKCMDAAPVYKTYAMAESDSEEIYIDEICEVETTNECHFEELVEEVKIIEQISLNEPEKILKRSRSSTRKIPEKPKEGIANAARVSRGSEEDTWDGLTLETPVRNEHEHLTISVVIYFTVAGGVPSEKDVLAAIDDMEMLYNACNAKGRLADEEFDFMKKELTVKDVLDINKKITEQPIQSK